MTRRSGALWPSSRRWRPAPREPHPLPLRVCAEYLAPIIGDPDPLWQQESSVRPVEREMAGIADGSGSARFDAHAYSVSSPLAESRRIGWLWAACIPFVVY